jgi:hypothetical protein
MWKKTGKNATFAHIWGGIQQIAVIPDLRRISAVVY